MLLDSKQWEDVNENDEEDERDVRITCQRRNTMCKNNIRQKEKLKGVCLGRNKLSFRVIFTIYGLSLKQFP